VRHSGQYESAGGLDRRYDECVRLACQLAAYCTKKATEQNWTPAQSIAGVELSVRAKVRTGEWALSDAECEWLLLRMRKRLENQSPS
jgi:hypothetical protein